MKVTKNKINIYSTGLSFHDVMLATGRIPSGPEVVFMDCTIGGEFAGRLAETGERVMGMESGRCFATSVYAATHTYSKIPDNWSMNDAVSILSTYSTAYYGLIKAGRLRKGESILIHSAAGGVGQSAINICKHYECDIYVTVGNDEKKQFLMNEYNIPENKIFNSRDILFKNQIMEATEGKGVDVVLNYYRDSIIACAYADGCLTTRDAMVVTYFRGAVTENDKNITKGLMAIVGLSKAEAKKVTPGGCYLACHNSKYNVVISGPKKEMSEMMKQLEEKAVFVRQLESSEIPYHSQYLITSAKPMTEAIKKYIPNPRLRSRKWVSTSLMTTDSSDEALKYASAEYFVYNLMNPVLFIDKLKDLPTDAIILELGPHSIFPKVVSETLDNSTYVSLIKRNANDTNLETFMAGLATLYESGQLDR
ncbi:unnamed protein product [Medioppia subpectinata]|uniref:Fatty acid synthase n=1 Tax=Medioppia subpectinata TaxID=1979941 RepID=A0A7R9Q121_9ACAR|nr:unnamed protein product [Medioppia subpectinata]CAG2108741.1 unnamed protein product [Medioppia subpectinata]